MKGLGNYRELPTRTSTERRVAQLALIHGPRATIRFIDGSMYTMPLKPLSAVGLVVGDSFVLVTTYRGKAIVDVAIERTQARVGPATTKAQAKVYVRDGVKVTTRKT